MKNSLHWYTSPCITNDYKIGLLGNFGRMYGLLTTLVKRVFFVYCVIQSTVDRAPRPYLYTRMRLCLWLPKVRKVNQFMLATFSTSLIIRRQAHSQVLRFEGKILFRRQSFCFYYMFKTNFSGHNKIREGHKITWGALPANASPRG